ncbi:DUF4274 domain-containing protein [Hymenobacter chitinivorans]|uniref:Uncharacterized protein DUF4274 n=1 Tax=Hymenobacter chitinivorans DSM 11115 TaxID=1121954 RepID=A0A2M9BR94_9BACT|nr:DUF4274 domain-containing protein [Hymenobacter chitinivorans]PJJ60457.1 uncharacterized protein DUF4274 [Hymenobacter chitinivorans DSM 11115]
MTDEEPEEDYLDEEELDALELKLLIEWLETVPPTEWHVLAQEWSYDNSKDILRWLLANPRTEKATALMIYWMAGARFYKQYGSLEEARARANSEGVWWEFIHDIEARYLAGFYTAATVGFDPRRDTYASPSGHDWTQGYQEYPLKAPLPAVMEQAVPGIQPSSEVVYIEGIPEHIYEQLEKYF